MAVVELRWAQSNTLDEQLPLFSVRIAHVQIGCYYVSRCLANPDLMTSHEKHFPPHWWYEYWTSSLNELFETRDRLVSNCETITFEVFLLALVDHFLKVFQTSSFHAGSNVSGPPQASLVVKSWSSQMA